MISSLVFGDLCTQDLSSVYALPDGGAVSSSSTKACYPGSQLYKVQHLESRKEINKFLLVVYLLMRRSGQFYCCYIL